MISIRDYTAELAAEAIAARAPGYAMPRKAMSMRLGLATPELDKFLDDFLREEGGGLEIKRWILPAAFECWQAATERGGEWLEEGDAPQWRQDLAAQELLDHLDELTCLSWYLATHAAPPDAEDEHRLEAGDLQDKILECHKVLEDNLDLFRGQTALAKEMLRQWQGQCPALLRQWSDHWRMVARLE